MDDLTAAVETMPFAIGLGLHDVVGDAGGITAGFAWAADHTTVGGALHGGYLMSVADSIGALVAFLNLPEGAATSTLTSSTNLTAAVTAGTCTVSSSPVHVGRSTIVVQTDIHRSDGRLVSRTTQTQAILKP
jgi:1,4-dihydroxy-2-naphthoyl-CoA hydrolase